jgi:hypothetical protein
MGYWSLHGTTRAAAFDKARWVGTPPRYRTDRYLVSHLIRLDEEPDRTGPADDPPAGQPPAAPPP